MLCPENCGRCCGPVPIPIEIYEKHKKRLEEHLTEISSDGKTIFAFRPDSSCAFLDDKKRCVMYDDRPDVCRKFGESETEEFLMCPLFMPNGEKRSRQNQRYLVRKNNKGIDRFIRNLKRRMIE